MKKPALTYAGPLERVLAFLIDKLIVAVPTAVLILLAGFTDGEKDQQAIIAIDYVCQAAYFTWFISSGWQASPGQRLLGIHVIHEHGRKLGMRHALERFIVWSAPQLPLYASFLAPNVASSLFLALVLFWFIPILMRADRTGVHDQFCGTRVVSGKTKSA